VLIFAAIVAIFVYGSIASMLGTILPELSERFGLTPTQNGTIAFVQALGLIIASIGVGPLLDTEGYKVGLILGLVLIAIALFWLPRSKGYQSILMLLFLLGLGGGIVVAGANALANGAAGEHRATVLNLVNLFFGLGGLTTPFISANLFKKDWVKLCCTIATITVVTMFIQMIPAMPAPSGPGFVLAEVGPVLGRPLLFMLSALLFLSASSEVAVWNWLPRHLIAQGVPESRALNILSLGFALGLLLGRLVVAPILINVAAVNVSLIASVAMAVTTYLMLKTRKPLVAGLLVFAAGLSMAPIFPDIMAITGQAFPRMTGTAMGIVLTCGWVGLAVSSRIIGGMAGSDPRRLKKALLYIPVASVLMVGLNVAIRATLR